MSKSNEAFLMYFFGLFAILLFIALAILLPLTLSGAIRNGIILWGGAAVYLAITIFISYKFAMYGIGITNAAEDDNDDMLINDDVPSIIPDTQERMQAFRDLADLIEKKEREREIDNAYDKFHENQASTPPSSENLPNAGNSPNAGNLPNFENPPIAENEYGSRYRQPYEAVSSNTANLEDGYVPVRFSDELKNRLAEQFPDEITPLITTPETPPPYVNMENKGHASDFKQPINIPVPDITPPQTEQYNNPPPQTEQYSNSPPQAESQEYKPKPKKPTIRQLLDNKNADILNNILDNTVTVFEKRYDEEGEKREKEQREFREKAEILKGAFVSKLVTSKPIRAEFFVQAKEFYDIDFNAKAFGVLLFYCPYPVITEKVRKEHFLSLVEAADSMKKSPFRLHMFMLEHFFGCVVLMNDVEDFGYINPLKRLTKHIEKLMLSVRGIKTIGVSSEMLDSPADIRRAYYSLVEALCDKLIIEHNELPLEMFDIARYMRKEAAAVVSEADPVKTDTTVQPRRSAKSKVSKELSKSKQSPKQKVNKELSKPRAKQDSHKPKAKQETHKPKARDDSPKPKSVAAKNPEGEKSSIEKRTPEKLSLESSRLSDWWKKQEQQAASNENKGYLKLIREDEE